MTVSFPAPGGEPAPSSLRVSKACLQNVFSVLLILIYLLLMAVAGFLVYQTITDFQEKLRHPVMSVSYKEVDLYDAPGKAPPRGQSPPQPRAEAGLCCPRHSGHWGTPLRPGRGLGVTAARGLCRHRPVPRPGPATELPAPLRGGAPPAGPWAHGHRELHHPKDQLHGPLLQSDPGESPLRPATRWTATGWAASCAPWGLEVGGQGPCWTEVWGARDSGSRQLCLPPSPGPWPVG